MSALTPKPNDLAVIQVPRQNPTDIRVPTAEEFALDAELRVQKDERSRFGWLAPPSISFTAPRNFKLNGSYLSSLYKKPLSIAIEITIPALSNADEEVNRNEYLSLIVLIAEVDRFGDPELGNFSFQYQELDDNNLVFDEVQTIRKENTRRLRIFWAIALHQQALNNNAIWTSLEVNRGKRYLTIASSSNVGFEVGSIRFFALDPNWVAGVQYRIINADAIEVAPIGGIQRILNQLKDGYIWGHNGEENLTRNYHFTRHWKLCDSNVDDDATARIYQLFAGLTGSLSRYNRAVRNLIGGVAPDNYDQPGRATVSPNSSMAVANDQRISFTNERRVHRYGVQRLIAANTGDGTAIVTATINTNSPPGTIFSQNNDDHRIYDSRGIERTKYGTFIESTGLSLNWIASPSSGIAPDDVVYFVPGIIYPSGSGFEVPFSRTEKVWRNNIELRSDNIRQGTEDLTQYEDPANDENFIVVYGRERSALHYIYKKVVVRSSPSGTALVPTTERGCFAFVEGINRRIDAPAVRGLEVNRNYKALIYYALPNSGEIWQFQFQYAPYQAVGSIDWLDGATIVSEPLFFVHSLGGGCSVYQGEGQLRYSPISSHLPAIDRGIPSYDLNNPIHLFGESYPGPVVFQPMPILAAKALALPKMGMTLNAIARDVVPKSRTLNVALTTSEGVMLGCRSPNFADSDYIFQYVVSFAVQKLNQLMLLVITHNNVGNFNIPFDTNASSAIGLFEL